MNEGLIPKRYARALLEYAQERNCSDELYEQMKTLQESLAATPGLSGTLTSPMVSPDEKARLISEAAEAGGSEVFRSFVRIVLANRRERFLGDISRSYMALYRKINHVDVVSLISVVPLPDETLDRIRRDVEERTHGRVEFATHIDPSIEGGFIFQINDLRLDASVAGQLERIRRQFIQKNRVIV